MRFALLVLCTTVIAVRAATPIVLSDGGETRLSVIVSDSAHAEVKATAGTLAEYLGRMAGAKFAVSTGDGARGIIVGTVAEFPGLAAGKSLSSGAAADRENYLLRSEKERLLLLGATPQAVEHAVWDVLHRLGYRQFFPGEKWEIVPRSASLSVAVDAVESPDYHSRKIWAGFGLLKEREKAVGDWNRRNRATAGITLSTGHAYDGVIRRNEAEFARHPEYRALVGGQRHGAKFCTANAGLRRLVVADALAQFAKEPTLDSLSCDPSDGGGWCECAECAKLGSVSDRALLLANEVAAAVNAERPGRLVGMYAYNEHSPPPSIAAHLQVVISVATGFIRGGFTIDQLLAGWSAKAQTLGIREYYSVNTWDRDAPGAARGGNLEYLRTTIPHFHRSGARFLSAEASDNFGPNGLGYYLAARMLWDIEEAKNLDALTADFLEKCFGLARAPMAKFYALLDGTKRQALSDDLVGRMWRLLEEARGLPTDVAVRARLDDLALYTHYAGLSLDYASAAGAERQAAFENLFRFVWRTRHTGMVHVKALWRDLLNRDKAIALPPLGKYSDPDATNPWKSNEPFTAEQIAIFIREGIASRKLLDFTPVSYSTKLVPTAPLKLKAYSPGKTGPYQRGVRDYWTWVEQAPATIALTATAGLVYANRGTSKIALYPLAEAESKAVAHFAVPPDKAPHAVRLATKFPGLHRLEVSDANQGTLIDWPAGTPMTLVSSPEQPATLFSRWYLHFYVPKGTPFIGGFADGEGWLVNPAGKTVHEFPNKPGYFRVPVPAGEDGKLWSFKNSAGNRQLMTVPPCLARTAEELLLPAEVVAKDSRP